MIGEVCNFHSHINQSLLNKINKRCGDLIQESMILIQNLLSICVNMIEVILPYYIAVQSQKCCPTLPPALLHDITREGAFIPKDLISGALSHITSIYCRNGSTK